MVQNSKGVRRFLWFLLGAASVVVVMFLFVMFIGMIVMLSTGAPSEVVERDTVLDISVSGPLSEGPQRGPEDPGAAWPSPSDHSRR